MRATNSVFTRNKELKTNLTVKSPTFFENTDCGVGSLRISKNTNNMKKILLSLAGLLSLGGIIAQPVSDNAIIPVSVTLNSILRLNVTSGGNIEFVINNLTQYSLGIGNNARFTTTFTVASSVDFDVQLYSELPSLVSNTGGASVSLDNLGYRLESTGTGVVGSDATDSYTLCGDDINPSTVQVVTNTPFNIIQSNAGNGAGNAEKNRFELQWRFGTRESSMNTSTLLQQSIPADRYSTNIFLVLSAS